MQHGIEQWQRVACWRALTSMEELAANELAALEVGVHIQPLQVLLIVIVQVCHGCCCSPASQQTASATTAAAAVACSAAQHAFCTAVAELPCSYLVSELFREMKPPAEDSGGRDNHQQRQCATRHQGSVLVQRVRARDALMSTVGSYRRPSTLRQPQHAKHEWTGALGGLRIGDHPSLAITRLSRLGRSKGPASLDQICYAVKCSRELLRKVPKC